MSSTPILGLNGNGSGTLPTARVEDMIPLFRPTKHFKRETHSHNPNKPSSGATTIVSLDYDNEGGLLLTSESDSTMQIYNVKEGKHHKTLLSQKYGVSHAMFGHAPGCIIHSSTKLNHTIRYLSTHDNSYLRYFEGHEANVTCLSLHPGQDNFVSCSEDNTVRIWDAATKNACGKLLLSGAYLAAWDPSGNVFAVASPAAQTILLYDFRNYDKAPFATFDMLPYYSGESPNSVSKGWSKLEFSNDGKSLLLGTTGSTHYVLDSFEGNLKASLRRDRPGVKRLGAGDHNPEGIDAHSNEYLYPTTGDCCFSPDARYVLSGTRGQGVMVWDLLAPVSAEKLLAPAHTLEHKGDSAIVAFNPRSHFFATADREVVFWLPDQSLA